MDDNSKLVCSCKGTGYIERINDGEVRSLECVCLARDSLLTFLGPELARAKHRQSPLFMPTLDPETGQVIGDRTLDNLFIKGVWSEVASHLRWALAGKKYVSPSFTKVMVNDERLLRVYVGDFAYHRRSSKVRDDIATYNNLADLILSQSLMIVRLGMMGWKNQAAAGSLLEALRIRASESKPTWLIEGERYFGDGHPFFNDEVDRYILGNFEIVDMGGDVKAAQATWATVVELSAETVMMGPDEVPMPVEASKERYLAEPGALEDQGRAYRDKHKNHSRRQRSGGSKSGSGRLPGDL